MTNPTPIETLLTKLEECFLRLSEEGEEMTHEHAFMAGYVFKRGGKLIEAFREVLEALHWYSDDGNYTHDEFGNQMSTAYGNHNVQTKALKALARANEIASQALGETKP